MNDKTYETAAIEPRTIASKAKASSDGNGARVLVVWLMFTILAGLPLLISNYCSSGRIVVGQFHDKPLRLVGVQGDTIQFNILDPRSHNGNWSSPDGVRLTLSDKGGDWSKSFLVLRSGVSSFCGTSCLEGSFVVPTLEARLLYGGISGLVRPRFGRNVHIERPVELQVVASGTGITSGEIGRNQAWRLMWLVLALNTAIGAPIIAVVHLRGRFIDTQKPHNSPLRLVGIPGDRITLQLFSGARSRDGWWGSKNGVKLALVNSPTSDRSEIDIVSPGTYYTGTDELGGIHARSSFQVPGLVRSGPDSQTSTELLDGHLTGDVQYLKSITEVETHRVDVPFTLRVVTEGATSGNSSLRTWRIFWIACALDVALIATLGISLVRLIHS